MKRRGQLRQWFAAGLRIDQEMQYLSAERRWRSLPVSQSVRADPGRGAIAAMQALALLTGRFTSIPENQPMPLLGDWLAQRLPGYGVKRVAGALMRYWPCIVSRTLQRGGVALVRLQLLQQSIQGLRWVLVVGVEERRYPACKAHVRALLVLDAAQPNPWLCGYNAKLMLNPHDGHSSSAIYSTLDGQRWRVRMVEGVCLQP
jgi:hypothetical protein